MAKKKKAKSKKKILRQAPRPAAVSSSPATPVAAASAPVPAAAISGSAAAPRPLATGLPPTRWSYVKGDVRRIGLFATICIVVELGLWYLLSFTGAGSAAYGLIK